MPERSGVCRRTSQSSLWVYKILFITEFQQELLPVVTEGKRDR